MIQQKTSIQHPSNRTKYLITVQFNHSVVSNSLQPHEPQHAWPPCASPTPRAYSNSYPLSRWCHQTISSTVSPFSSCPQSFPASGSFQISQLFASGGQSTGVLASASVLGRTEHSNEHSGLISFRMNWLDFLAVQGLFTFNHNFSRLPCP